VPGGVLVPRVRLQERVLIPCARLHAGRCEPISLSTSPAGHLILSRESCKEGRAPARARSRLVDGPMPFTSTGCFELACLLLFPFVLVPLPQGLGAFVFEVR
jgi:hypothetical protein